MNASELASLGGHKIMDGMLLEGLECYREALRLEPENYDIYWSYFTWLEEAIIEVPAYTGDALLCLENIIKLINRDDLPHKQNMWARYADLANTYFRHKDFHEALVAAQNSMKFSGSNNRLKLFEAYVLYHFGMDLEKRYEAICDDTIAAFVSKVCSDRKCDEAGATDEQLQALKTVTEYDLPMELVKYVKAFMPAQSVSWKESSKLLSFEEMLQLNRTSPLTKLGFFIFATVEDEYYICMDLLEKTRPVYQCSKRIITDKGICFPDNSEIKLELTYENVKKVSIESEMNFILFIDRFKEGYITLRDEEDMEHQYGYNKYLEESGFKTLEVEVKDKRKEADKMRAAFTEADDTELESETSDDEDENVMYKEIAHKITDIISQETKKECLKFTLKSGNPGILDSKVGGTPFVPVGGEYPVSVDSGEMLYLLAQINFEQIPHLPDFPTKGILQFFIGGDDLFGCDFGNNEQRSWRIIYHEDISSPMDEKEIENLMDQQKKGDDVMLPFDELGQGYFMELEEVTEPMSCDDYRYQELFMKELKKLGMEEFDDVEEFYFLPDEITDVIYDGFSGLDSKIGGYPGFTQSDPREDDDNYKDYELLLQVDSECADGEWAIMWGDSGIANFFIHPEDLKKLDFSKVLYNWDCC